MTPESFGRRYDSAAVVVADEKQAPWRHFAPTLGCQPQSGSCSGSADRLSSAITGLVEITLEGVNLTDEFNDQFISSVRNSPVVYTHTGREFLFGARFKY